MPSFVIFVEQSRYYPNTFVFGVFNYDTVSDVYVSEFKDGIFTIDASEGANIEEFLRFVEGIFHPESNFASHVCERFNVPEESFKGVKFDFNKIKFEVTKENANSKKLYEYWKKEAKKILRRW